MNFTEAFLVSLNIPRKLGNNQSLVNGDSRLWTISGTSDFPEKNPPQYYNNDVFQDRNLANQLKDPERKLAKILELFSSKTIKVRYSVKWRTGLLDR